MQRIIENKKENKMAADKTIYPKSCPRTVTGIDPWDDEFKCRKDLIKLYTQDISLDANEKESLNSILNKVCQYCIQTNGMNR